MITISLFYCCSAYAYPYEHMDDLEKFNETSLLEEKKKKKIFIVKNFYMEDITDAAYAHAKRVSKDFEIKKFRRISWFVCSKR